jgi:uncharacterized membrane protein YczE
MKHFLLRFLRLMFGLFLYALGIVFTIRAAIGYAPWEVFHVGLSMNLGISIGTASIAVGILIIVIIMLNKERVGLGTLLNIFAIGLFLDGIMALGVIPVASGTASGIAMLIAGLFIIALGSYFYIDSGFGAGPRDSLMVLLSRKTRLAVGLCRNIIEFSAALAGWLLGGMIGIGTVVSVIVTGLCVQLVFRLFRFDPKAVRHQTLRDTWRELAELKKR